MPKIDVITLHAVKNYGSVLQTFATQEKLRQLGCESKSSIIGEPTILMRIYCRYMLTIILSH